MIRELLIKLGLVKVTLTGTELIEETLGIFTVVLEDLHTGIEDTGDQIADNDVAIATLSAKNEALFATKNKAHNVVNGLKKLMAGG